MEIHIVPIFLAIVVIACLVLLNKSERNRYIKLIEEKINSLGGTLISSKMQNRLFNKSPYIWVGKYQAVYHFEYVINGEFKDGWVRIGLWDEPDWRL